MDPNDSMRKRAPLPLQDWLWRLDRIQERLSPTIAGAGFARSSALRWKWFKIESPTWPHRRMSWRLSRLG